MENLQESVFVFRGRLLQSYLSRDGRSSVWVFYIPYTRKVFKTVCRELSVSETSGLDRWYGLLGFRHASTCSYCASVVSSDFSILPPQPSTKPA